MNWRRWKLAAPLRARSRAWCGAHPPRTPRLQPRGPANCRTGPKTMPGPWGLPVRSASSVPRSRLSIGARAACSGGYPLPKGAGYPWPTDDQPHRARSLMHLYQNRTTEQTTHHEPTTPPPHDPRGVERHRDDALADAPGHHATPRQSAVPSSSSTLALRWKTGNSRRSGGEHTTQPRPPRPQRRGHATTNHKT